MKFLDTVQRVLPDVVSLTDYIKSNSTIVLTDEGSDPTFLHYFESIKVLPDKLNKNTHFHPPLPSEDTSTIIEILNRFISHQIERRCQDRTSSNCLLQGFRSKSMNSKAIARYNDNLECHYVNTLHSYFYNPYWKCLAKQIGELFLRHIFSLPIFLPVNNNCYLQLCGMYMFELIHSLQPQSATVVRSVSDSMSHRVDMTNGQYLQSRIASSRETCSTVMNYKILRNSLFYKDKYQRNVGLPNGHVIAKVTIRDTLK